MVRKAMILAAGFGTRLRPLTHHLPKPLVPVANVSLLDYHLRALRAAGVEEVLINLHHLSHLIREQVGDGGTWGVRVRYSAEEPHVLGTGGGLSRVRDFFEKEENFLLINSDVLHTIDLRPAVRHHVAHKAVATMIVLPYLGGRSWIGVDGEGWVRYVPDMLADNSSERRLFTGLHVLTPKIFEHLPAGRFGCVLRAGYRPLIEAGLPVTSYLETADKFQEIGTPGAYLKANLCAVSTHDYVNREEPDRSLIRGALIPPHLIGRNVVVEEGARVGPYAVVGDDAFIGRHSSIRHSVVWPAVRLPPDADLNHDIAFAGDVLHVRD